VTRNFLSGALLGIYNSGHHDRKSLFYRRSGSYRGFFSAPHMSAFGGKADIM